jgi:hypothetical protein
MMLCDLVTELFEHSRTQTKTEASMLKTDMAYFLQPAEEAV